MWEKEFLSNGIALSVLTEKLPFGDSDQHLVGCPYPEISIVTRGIGVQRLNSGEIPCKAGDVYMIPPGFRHGYVSTEPTEELEIVRLVFDPSRLLSSSISDTENAHYCYGIFGDGILPSYAMLNATTQKTTLELLEAIRNELANRSADWESALLAHLTLLLITLSRYVGKAIKNAPDLPQKEREIATAAMQAVSNGIGDGNLTLERIASGLYVSQSYLSRLFKKMTGESFSEYLRNLRLSRACELLKDTTMTVDRIVECCGLRDLPSFYHAFRAHTGMTPHQYRTQQMSIQNQKQLGEKIMSILNEMSENLQKGKAKLVKELVEKAIAEGCDPTDILNEGLLGGMSIIGEKFKNNEVYVPEVLVAARAMNIGVSVLKPYLVENGITATGKVCIGTVQGDLHDIGKNLVRMMLESKGLEVIDLGVDVPAERFVQTAIDEGCQVICCSALLTTTMSVMETVVQKAEEAGIRDKVKIMIGGAPVNEEFREKIGADCYTTDAASAADAAATFCREA